MAKGRRLLLLSVSQQVKLLNGWRLNLFRNDTSLIDACEKRAALAAAAVVNNTHFGMHWPHPCRRGWRRTVGHYCVITARHSAHRSTDADVIQDTITSIRWWLHLCDASSVLCAHLISRSGCAVMQWCSSITISSNTLHIAIIFSCLIIIPNIPTAIACAIACAFIANAKAKCKADLLRPVRFTRTHIMSCWGCNGNWRCKSRDGIALIHADRYTL